LSKFCITNFIYTLEFKPVKTIIINYSKEKAKKDRERLIEKAKKIKYSHEKLKDTLKSLEDSELKESSSFMSVKTFNKKYIKRLKCLFRENKRSL
jgi:hypothetical protein